MGSAMELGFFCGGVDRENGMEIWGNEDIMKGTYGFLSGWYFLLSVRYALLMSFSVAERGTSRSL